MDFCSPALLVLCPELPNENPVFPLPKRLLLLVVLLLSVALELPKRLLALPAEEAGCCPKLKAIVTVVELKHGPTQSVPWNARLVTDTNTWGEVCLGVLERLSSKFRKYSS